MQLHSASRSRLLSTIAHPKATSARVEIFEMR